MRRLGLRGLSTLSLTPNTRLEVRLFLQEVLEGVRGLRRN